MPTLLEMTLDYPAPYERLGKLIEEYSVQTVLEIGTFVGASARYFAERVQSVTCVDPFFAHDDGWAREIEARGIHRSYYLQFVKNMEKYGVMNKITVIIGKSQDVSRLVASEFDMVYFDGSHDYEPFAEDLRLYAHRAKKVLVGDDYHLDANHRPYFPGVHRAVTEFFGQDYCIDNWTWWKAV